MFLRYSLLTTPCINDCKNENIVNLQKFISRVTFKSQLKVGGNQSTTLNVINQNVGHTLKIMNLPGANGHCWCGLRNPRWRPRWLPEINARWHCKRFVELIYCILIHHISDINFCCICVNFFMVTLNVVSIEKSRSNSRSITKNSAKKLIAILYFVILPKFTKMERIIIHQSKLECKGFNYSNKNLKMLCFHGDIQDGV